MVVVDAATFLAVAVLFGTRRRGRLPRRQPAPAPATAATTPAGLLRDWLAGSATVRRSPALRRAMAVLAPMALAQGAFVVLFVLFVVRDLQGSDADVGLLRGVQAIGGLAGGALFGLVLARWEPRRLTAVSLAAFGVLSLTTWNAPAVTTALGLYVGLFISVGVPGLGSMTGLMTVLQTAASSRTRGRVVSTFLAAYGGLQAVGMLVAGLVGSGVGLTVALEVQGCLYLGAAALALRLPGSPPTGDEPGHAGDEPADSEDQPAGARAAPPG